MLVNGATNAETTLVSLSGYSTLANMEWRPSSAVVIPVTEPTDVAVIINHYCNVNGNLAYVTFM